MKRQLSWRQFCAAPLLVLAGAALPACAYLQPPAPIRKVQPIAAAPLPVVAAPAPPPAPVAAPEPVYIPPDYTALEGHSSRSVPVPVAPVEVGDLEPVIGN